MTEISVRYDLETPWGTIEFNRLDLASRYWLTMVDGLASPSMRTTTSAMSARDGERVNPAFAGARYPVLRGQVVADGATEAALLLKRRQMLDDLAAAQESIMREDGLLKWTPSGGPGRQLSVRAFERLQISGTGMIKEFQLGLVAGNPVPVSWTLEQDDSTLLSVAQGAGQWTLGTAGGAPAWALGDAVAAPDWSLGLGASPGLVMVTNEGNSHAWPFLRVHGQVSGSVRVTNLTTGESIVFHSLEVPAGSYAEIDTWNETVYLNGQANQSLLGGLNSASSVFWTLPPGSSSIQLYADAFDANAMLTVLHRDSFA